MKTKITLLLQTIIVLLFLTANSYSQSSPTINLSQSAACTYSGCNAKDLTITKSFIGNSDGTALNVCNVGDATTAYLFITVDTGPKYNIYVQFDLYWNDVKVNTTGKYSYGEPVTGTEIPSIPINIAQINFTCGGKLELKNIYVSWKTGGSSNDAAGCASSSVGSKCTESGFIPNIVVNTPLAVDYSYSTSCTNGVFQQIEFTNTSSGGDGTLTYLWDFGAGATPATSTASGKSPSPITVTYSSAGTKNISLKVTDIDGDSDTKTKTISVESCCTTPVIANKTATICSGTSFSVNPTTAGNDIVPTGTTYTWSTPVSSPVGAITGGTFQSTGAVGPISQTLGNATNSAATLTYTVTPKSGSCIGSVFTVTVTVNALPAIIAQPTAPTATCSGSGSQTMTVTATGTGLSYQWRKGGMALSNGGVISGATTASLTLTNPTASDAGSYDVVVSGTCTPAVTSTAVTVAVNALPAITAQPTAPTATCSGSGSQTMTVTATGTGLSYQWRKGGMALSNGGVISGATTASLTLTDPTASDAGSYDVIVSGTCTPAVTSTAVTVAVNALPAITAQPTAPTATCSGSGSQTMTVTATGTGLSYQWRKGGIALSNGGVISGATTASLTLTNPTASDAGSYDVIVSGTCTPAVTSTAVTVAVNALPAITAQPTAPTATCSGSSSQTMTVTATGTGLSYQWRKGGIALSNGGVISGATTASLTLTNPTASDAGSYDVVVSGTCTPAVTSTAVTVTVNALPAITAQPTAPTATCSGSSSQTMTVTATGTGLSYQWRKGGMALSNGGVISGATTASLTLTNPTASDAGSYDVVVSGTCTPAVTSTAVTVAVNALPAITAQPTAPTATCSGSGSQTMTVIATGTGLSYQWRKGGIALSNGGVISGATTASLTLTNPTASDAGSYDVVVSGTCTPAVTSTAVTVAVNALPAITAQPTAPTATCSGSGSQTMTVIATGTGLSYQWRKGGMALSNGGVISGATTASLTLTNPTASDAGSYDVVVSGTCTPAVTSTAVTVTVNALPAITAQPTAPTATCSGSGSQTMTVTATGTGLSYQWRKGGMALSNGGVISGATTASLTLTNPTASDAGSYDVIVSGTCTPAVTSTAVTVTVNALPAITAQPTAPTATCSGSSSQTMTVTATGTGLSYQWRKGGMALSNGGVISGATTASLTLTNPTASDAGSYDVVVSGTCTPAVTSTAVTVAVNALPAITAQPTAPTATCSGSGSQTMTVTATGTGLSYQWRKGGIALSNGGVISGATTASLTLTNPTASDAGSYDVVVSGTCTPAVTSTAVTVAVNALPTLSGAAQASTVCAGSTATLNLTGLLPNSTSTIAYTINGVAQTSVTSVVSSASGAASFTSAALTAANNGQILQITGITITSATPNCSKSFTQNVALSVNPETVGGTVTSAQTICYGTAPANLTLSGNTGTVVKWQKSSDVGFTNYTDITETSTILLGTTIGNLIVNTYFRAVVKSGTCPEADLPAVLITVNPKASASDIDAQGKEICTGSTAILNASSNTVAEPSFNWYSDVNLTTLLHTGPSYTTPTLTATTTYYVSVQGTAVCENAPNSAKEVKVTVNPKASASDINAEGKEICTGSTAILNTSSNTVAEPYFNWYSDVDLTTLLHTGPSYTTPTLTATTTYYVSVQGTAVCENAPNSAKEVKVTVNPKASASDINAQGKEICTGSTAILNASSNTVAEPSFNWYSDVDLTTLLHTGPSYTTITLTATTTYYVSVQGTAVCENAPNSAKEVKVTVNPKASASDINAQGKEICTGSTAILNASSNTVVEPYFNWYSDVDLTTLLHTGPSYTTPTLTATTTYYVSVQGTAVCENAPNSAKEVKVTVNPKASASDINAQGKEICTGSTAILNASSNTVAEPSFNWYSDVDLTTLLHTGPSYTTPTLTATSTYYVSVQGTAVCENAPNSAKEVKVTVNPKASASDINAQGKEICTGSTAILNASSNTVVEPFFNWYSDVDLTTLLHTGPSYTTPTLTATTTYYVSVQGTAVCENAPNSAKEVKVTVNPKASASDINAQGKEICTGSTAILNASSNTVSEPSFNWYSDVDLTTLLHTGPSYTTPTLTATTTYYVSVQGTAVCENAPNSAKEVKVTVNPKPTPIIIGLSSVCSGDKDYVYSATNVEGHAYSWTVAGGSITAGIGTNSITVTWGSAGIGTVDLTEVITTTTCSTVAIQKTVAINTCSIAIEKDGIYVDPTPNHINIPKEGDKIKYTFYVTNSGNVNVHNVVIKDDRVENIEFIKGDINTIGILEVGEKWEYEAFYTITQADINKGFVYNLAFANAKDPNDIPVPEVTSTDPTPCDSCPKDPTCNDCTSTITPLNQSPKLEVKIAQDNDRYSFIGDIINYTITVTNTGNVTLHDIRVTDSVTGLDITIQGSLAPGESIQPIIRSHTIVKDDLVREFVTNTANAVGLTITNNEVPALPDSKTAEKATVLPCESIYIYNAFSPNGDGINEKFIVDGFRSEFKICYPENTVEIYNRWGVLVFETKNYDNETNFFEGYSRGRTTVSESSGLPTGTYFYIISYSSIDGIGDIQTYRKEGYLYLTR
ncbi:gliding motility-associated C-terminal domain-containing protein [Flavobacterium ovatum]|uniref:Ig-like domain-containing protein n=1 Tax=Flavobacterium ovatum TaxID=1928857 RepID=UPI00344BCFDA